MFNSRNCSIVLVRHGHTKYTEKFPDITSEGRKSLIQTATLISVFAEYHQIKIFSSPKPRAQGSASCLSSALSVQYFNTVSAPDITAVQQRQPEVVRRLIKKYATSKDPLAIEKAYWTEPEFNNPEIVEPRADIRKRFYSFLDRLVRIGLVCEKNSPDCFVCVSHAEVIGHIVRDSLAIIGINRIPAVAFAQPIFLKLSQAGVGKPTFVDFTFSGIESCQIRYSNLK